MARRYGLKEVPLSQVLRRLDLARRGNRDSYVHLGRLNVTPTTRSLGDFEGRLQLEVNGGATEDACPPLIAFRNRSIAQFCRFLGVPPYFAERLPAALLANVLNYLVDSRTDELVLLRLARGKPPVLRAILKANYSRISDRSMLDALLEAPAATPLRPTNVSILEDTFHLRLIFPDDYDVGLGGNSDLINAGIDLLNSETGAHPLQIRICVFRQVCENGLTVSDKIHENLRLRHDRLDRHVAERTLEHAINWSLDHGPELARLYGDSHSVQLTDAEATLAGLMKRHKLGSPAGRAGFRILIELRKSENLFGITLFDFIQAVTAAAKTFSVTQRLQFEDAVGEMMVQRGRELFGRN